MFRPAAFAVPDPGPLLTGLLAEVAATVVTVGPQGLTSSIVPLLFDADAGPRGTLSGHVSRGNPIVRERHGGEALVVVTGVAGYITPSWYPSKAEHARVVPTWDYVTVEAAGPLVLRDDPGWLLDLVSRLTDRHEATRVEPWSVADAPEDYVAATLKGIVGIELALTRLVGKAKLSQNRSEADIAGVIAGLRADGTAASLALADAVEQAG
ncbi:FMN-binding negative transcriptional regulator [soil metagenome]